MGRAEPRKTRRGAGQAVQVSLTVCGLAMCLYYSPFSRSISLDNQIYYYIAEQAARGVPPHVSLVDHKHQLAALLSSLAIRAGAPFGIDGLIAARLLSLAVAALCPLLVFRLARALRMDFAAALLSGATMLAFIDFYFIAAVGVRPKTFMAFFLILGLGAFAAQRPARAGAYAAASFLCWQPAGWVTAALATFCVVPRPRPAALLRLCAGFATANLLYEAYYWWHGALGEQLYQSYRMPADLGGYGPKPLWEGLRFLLAMGNWRWDSGALLSAFTLAVCGLWLVRAAASPKYALAQLRVNPEAAAVSFAGAGALALTLIDHQAYPDLFFLYPFAALACGYAAAALARGFFAPLLGVDPRLAYAGVLVCLAFIIRDRVDVFPRLGGTLEAQRAVAAEIDLARDQFGPVWAVGCPHIPALNGWTNHTPFGLLIDPKVRRYMDLRHGTGRWRPLDAQGRLPGVILASRGGLGGGLQRWINREYRRLEHARFKAMGITVWIPKATAPPLP